MQFERMERADRAERGNRNEVAEREWRLSNSETHQNEELAEMADRAEREDRVEREIRGDLNWKQADIERDTRLALSHARQKRTAQIYGSPVSNREIRLGNMSKYFQGRDMHYYPKAIKYGGFHVAEPEVAVGDSVEIPVGTSLWDKKSEISLEEEH
eukprot:TRINITY_DN4152_c0_g1_i1.p1 TRINITY_DN4152_c0_g1~~TRINITY_DN4152_c0_g1_i1.p1  ORF type:complete len:156 (+),score=11.83 TRINITY_DN4152_c0_g1_i1:229-696(+)